MTEFLNQEFFALFLFIILAIFFLMGYPVALTLAGTAILVGIVGFLFDIFPLVLINVLQSFSEKIHIKHQAEED